MISNIVIIRNAARVDFGGGERVPVFIARALADDKKFHPIVLSRSQKLLDFAKKESVDNMKSWWWSRQNWSGKYITLTPIYIVWQIILFVYYVSIFLRLRPSVVHLQSKDDFIAGTFAARILRIRVLWSDYADLKHIFLNHKVWYKNPVGKMVYFAGHYAEKILVVSKQDKSLISVHIPDGPIKNKLEVIYYGAFDSYRKNVEKYDNFTFVSSSRIVTDKGVGELIEAFNAINKLHADTKLLILGDGPERDHFEKIARPNKSIEFAGYKTNPLDYVAKSHVFIIPTYHEGFSIALVEACMLGLSIIATDVGGNPEIIRHKKTGLLVVAKDSSSLFDSMEELYNNKELREIIARNARKEYVDKFNFETIIKKQLKPLYEGKR